MDYFEVSFTYDSPVDTDLINDLLSYVLGSVGYESFVTEKDGLHAYIVAEKYNEKTLNDCLFDFPLPNVRFYHTKQFIQSCNWNEEWEKNYFQPICIGKECLIRASFHPDMQGFRYTIVIDPKMSFGTGNHATTHLMLCELLSLDLNGKTFLDMGCGTGVLAILAAMKKAAPVVAIDIDEWAYNNTIENCRLNQTEAIEVALGGAEQIARYAGVFDYIFANINRNILLNDIRLYAPALRTDGSLFMSGFYTGDVPAIEEECRKQGLSLSSVKERDDWVAVQAKKVK